MLEVSLNINGAFPVDGFLWHPGWGPVLGPLLSYVDLCSPAPSLFADIE